MRKDEVITILQAHREELDELHVASLELFGSTARGEARPDSDVDLLVAFDERVGLLHFVGVKKSLEEILGCTVDLVTRGGLRPEYRDQVLAEAVRAA